VAHLCIRLIPEGVMSLGQVKRPWPVSKGADRCTASATDTFVVFRATPPPSQVSSMRPEGLGTCTRRIRSNTPLQALTLLNDTAFDEFRHRSGRAFAECRQE